MYKSIAPPSLQVWRRVCPSAKARIYSDKAPIYLQGETVNQLYAIDKGYVKLTHITFQGQQNILAILTSGDLFGPPFDAVTQSGVSHSAFCKGKTSLIELPDSSIASLLTDTSLAEFIVDSTAQRRRFYELRLQCLLDQNVRQRIVSILIELCTNYGRRCPHGHEVDIRLSQQELAELVGASRPVVSTTINQFRRLGHISYTREYICIENLAAFRQLALSKSVD